MSIFDELDTGVRALVRTGRHGPTAIDWSEPFEASLYIQKDNKGRCCVLALEGHNFADFDPRRETETETLLTTEDYALEVLQLPSAQRSLLL